MKKILITLILLLMAVSLHAQNDAISRFFSQYMDDERFSSVYISGKMFNLFAKITDDEDEKVMRETISKLGGLRILSSDKVNGVKMFEEVSKNLTTKGFEELMFIKEGGKPEMQFLVKEANGKINELLMLSGSGNEFFMLSLIGDIDLNQISKLSKSMDIQGMENLEKIGKNNNPKK